MLTTVIDEDEGCDDATRGVRWIDDDDDDDDDDENENDNDVSGDDNDDDIRGSLL